MTVPQILKDFKAETLIVVMKQGCIKERYPVISLNFIVHGGKDKKTIS